jgi:hypothetical protein
VGNGFPSPGLLIIKRILMMIFIQNKNNNNIKSNADDAAARYGNVVLEDAYVLLLPAILLFCAVFYTFQNQPYRIRGFIEVLSCLALFLLLFTFSFKI